MSTDYTCSRSTCSHEAAHPDQDWHCPTCEKCDWRWTSTWRSGCMEPSFTRCPVCEVGHVEVYGRPHVPVRRYTRDDLVRAILGQQWAVACSQLKPMAMIDLKKRRRYTSWGIWRPSAASRAIASLPSPDDVVTAMEQV